MVTKEQIIERLETVMDPEVNFDIWTLGLIYEINIIDEKTVHIVMTYTTPLCPAGPQLQEAIRTELIALGFEAISLEVTFDPPWEMPEALKVMLGL